MTAALRHFADRYRALDGVVFELIDGGAASELFRRSSLTTSAG
jgi:hypothetical protein